MRGLPFIAITAAGFAGSVGQILIVRELFVIFYGNELTAGVILTAWMLWIAAGSVIGGKFGHPLTETKLEYSLILLAVLLPATILWIRGARIIGNIPGGEMLSPETMIGITVSATAPFCFTAGLIFSLAWSLQTSDAGKRHPIIVYMGEAVGAAAGGLMIYLLFLPLMPAFQASLFVSAAILGIPAITVASRNQLQKKPFLPVLWGLSAAAVISGFWFSSDLDMISHRWQIGKDVVAVRDSPYNHLSLTVHNGQWTVFANSIWLFSTPDVQTSESAIHPVLLQHPSPKSILLLGSAGADPVKEILKYADVTRLDLVESDPNLLPFIAEYLPDHMTVLNDERIRIIHKDARLFVRTTRQTYDVILMTVGDPMSAQMNRFYTDSFFEMIHRRLTPGGIFSFSVSASPDILGTAQIQYLQSVYETLRQVFRHIVIYPGENLRFLAASETGVLTLNPDDLTDRKNALGLRLQYIRDDYFYDLLSPFRLEYITKILKKPLNASVPQRINRDFSPTCYYYSLVLWGTQLHAGLKKYLAVITGMSQFLFWSVFGGALLIGILIWQLVQPGFKTGVAVCAAVTGCALITEEIILLLGFQILTGYIYQGLCLIIALFMAGLAIGSGLSRFLYAYHSGKVLFIVQNLIGCHLVITMGGMIFLHSVGASASVSWIFSILAVSAGMLGGVHFSISVNAVAADPVPGALIGGGLYALDLVGGAAGALMATLIIIPIFGLTSAILSVALLTFAASVILIL